MRSTGPATEVGPVGRAGLEMTMAKHARPPADPGLGEVAQFGYSLRQLRQKKELSYAAVAAASYYSRSCIHAADHGYQLPSENVVSAFVTACGEDPEPYLAERNAIADRLAAAKSARTTTTRPRKAGRMPDPTLCTSKALFVDGLKQLREWSGLTFREIDEITRSTAYEARLPCSSWNRALQGGDLPRRPMVVSFLKAIDLNDRQQKLWLDQWSAVFHGYAEAVSPPAWARISTGTQALVCPKSQATVPVRDWTLDDSGAWVEVPYSEMPTHQRRHHPVVVAIAVLLLVTILLITTVAVWSGE